MSDTAATDADRLREELATRESEMTYRQAIGEDVSAIYEQVLALRSKLERALAERG